MATSLLLPEQSGSSGKLLGLQEPSLLRIPERAGSRAGEALDLAAVAGLREDPWQELTLDAILSIDAAERWVCTEFGVLVSRQNGKGNIILPYELAHLFLWPKADGEPKTILHSAHEVKTAVEAFRRLKRVITASPLLMGELLGGERGIKDNNQWRGFELANGNRLMFMARSRNAGVGFTVDVLVVDEAQETPQAAMDALLPTMSAVDNTQVLFTGTVPDELNNAEYWEGVRDRGRSGTDPRTGWAEFNPKGSHDPDVAAKINIRDPQVWRAGNPGLGYRPGLTRATIEDEISRLDPEAVKRLRFSIWPNRREEEAEKLSELDIAVWKRVAGDYPVHGDGGVIAIAVGRGGGYATISKAIRVDEDHIAVEHHKTDRKVRWVADEVKALKAELGNALVVVDPKNAAMILADLDRVGVKYLAMNLDEIAAAHSIFIELSNDGLVLHRDQREVTRSLELATTRAIGRAGFTWEPSDPTKPISHAQSVTWAVWGVIKSEASPKKRTPPPPKAAVLTRDSVARDEVDLRSAGF
ncbi:phage terminase family protein [Leucobacter tenebrionis]|uniref:phage terminase family protein n=1 Tax=Leucobacter tenebrionis TaxID=2873270 RepID=UPI001CA68FEB|nr:phage terminase family protein [Leucobacter tenebrionis]QZY52912.1 phage terminase family protein [Leucobacter tenebrionis]